MDVAKTGPNGMEGFSRPLGMIVKRKKIYKKVFRFSKIHHFLKKDVSVLLAILWLA